MNSGSAASDHDALALQTVVASTEPDRNCRADEQHGDEADQPDQRDRDPHAAGQQDDEKAEQDQRQLDESEIDVPSAAPPAATPLDHLFGGLRLGSFS